MRSHAKQSLSKKNVCHQIDEKVLSYRAQLKEQYKEVPSDLIPTNGYIGSSTRSEIEYAEAAGKPVRYLE